MPVRRLCGEQEVNVCVCVGYLSVVALVLHNFSRFYFVRG